MRFVASCSVPIVVALLAAACSSESTVTVGAADIAAVAVADRAGDGILDCIDGQIERGAPISVTGGSEQEVVAAALSDWTAVGAELTAFTAADESWVATLDGRDVAVAVPEQNGDGSWVVHDVRTCGDPSTGPAPIDGGLDCVDDYSWLEHGDFASDVVGSPSPAEALRASLQPFAVRHGGEIVLVRDVVGSLIIDDREQVVSRAEKVPGGGWVVSTIMTCAGFER